MSILAWHFVGETLRNGDPIPVDGEWLEYSGPLGMCNSGLHASRDPFDALQYAPGPTLCRVEMDGELIEGGDKLVASRRRIIERHDITGLLRAFAREQALSVIHLWNAPQIVREYLESGDESLRDAAWDAARSAALDAALDAARGAAWSAARDAARSAARSAAWDAAGSAALDAAWGSAWSAALDAARSAALDAAWGAAWSAAWNAARSAARARFNELVRREFDGL